MSTPRSINNLFAASALKRFLAFALLLSSFSAAAADLEASVSVSPVGDFTAEIKGFAASARVKGDSYVAPPFKIPWADLKTGMGLRDKHALKYVNAEKHPHIEVLQSLGKNGKGIAKVKFNGVEKLVKGTYKIEGSNLIASFSIILSEFNVKDVSFKGAGVKDEVKVKMTVPVAAPATGS